MDEGGSEGYQLLSIWGFSHYPLFSMEALLPFGRGCSVGRFASQTFLYAAGHHQVERMRVSVSAWL